MSHGIHKYEMKEYRSRVIRVCSGLDPFVVVHTTEAAVMANAGLLHESSILQLMLRRCFFSISRQSRC